ncbi:MAG: hypothetical protein R2941_10140 [Desulfobacterales bacterium]
MLNTFNIYSELKNVLDDTAARKLAHVLGEICEEIQNTVRKEDFSELKGIIKELAHAQKRTENRMDEVAVSVKELAEAQKRTEIKVEELADAQKRTEIKIGELAEAQKRTEKSLKHLADEQAETRKQVGGLTNTVGYRLEDLSCKYLPELLEKDYRIKLKDRLTRKHIKDKKGNDLEINIIGEGVRDGSPIAVVGESKSQLSKNDVDRFVKNRLSKLEGLFPDIFPVLVTHMISQPDVEEYAGEKGIAVYYSYDFA